MRPNIDSRRARGEGTHEDIHHENLARVSSMSLEEVEEAQAEIFSTFSAASLDILRRRGRAQATGSYSSGGRSHGHGDGEAGGTGGAKGQTGSPTDAPSSPASLSKQRDTDASSALIAAATLRPNSVNGTDNAQVVPMATAPREMASNTEDSNTDKVTREDEHTPAADATAGRTNNTGGNGDGEPDDVCRRSVGGAPTGAQRAATLAGGVDSEEGLAAALKSLPQEERAKSSWMMSSTAATGDAGEGGEGGGGDVVAECVADGGSDCPREELVVRVDLDGVPVEGAEEASAGVTSALYHHGDEPGKAGYTPAELVRLARYE